MHPSIIAALLSVCLLPVSSASASLQEWNDLLSDTAVIDTLEDPIQLWQAHDIGLRDQPGELIYDEDLNVLQITSTGYGAEEFSDSFHFLSRFLDGDGYIETLIDLSTIHGIGGVMMREALDEDSPGLFFGWQEDGALAAVERPFKGGPMMNDQVEGSEQLSSDAAVWLRIARAGDLFTASYSVDGSSWSLLDRKHIPMSSRIYWGLAAAAGAEEDPGYLEALDVNVVEVPKQDHDAFLVNESREGISNRGRINHDEGKSMAAPGRNIAQGVLATLLEAGVLSSDSPLHADRFIYVDEKLGSSRYNGRSSTVSGNHGPKKDLREALRLVKEGDIVVVGEGFYTVPELNPNGVSYTMYPLGNITYNQSPE